MASVRIDKWLWAARFFKTRALASKACDLGRIFSNDIQAKAAREVRVGDRLRVKNEGGEFQIEVLQLSEMRHGAVCGCGLLLRLFQRDATQAGLSCRLRVQDSVDGSGMVVLFKRTGVNCGKLRG